MTLDPQVRALLERLAASGAPPLEELSPEQARAASRAFLVVPQEQREPVFRVEDGAIPGPDGTIPIRIYRPSDEPGQPAIVYYHGGGWVRGDLDTYDHVCRALANRTPCTVVSVDYRLAPEHPFPAPVMDAEATYAFIVDSAAGLGLDADRIAVGGDSAGANLATAVCYLARESGGQLPRCQVLIYPVTSTVEETASMRAFSEGYYLTRPGMAWFADHYLPRLEDRQNPLASPLLIERLNGMPPALIITAEYDPLRDEGEMYARRLEDAGVPVVLTRYTGMIHGFVNLALFIDRGWDAVDEVASYLRTAFTASTR